MSIHDGHRQRLKQRFLEEGLESFTDIQVLELLLFFSVPRQDTNPIAHALLDHFGSLYQVLEAPEYLVPFFFGRNVETVFLLCLDAKCKVLCCKEVGQGSVNSAGISVRKIVETALAANATTVVLAHNHPSGIAVPSSEDVQTTCRVAMALNAVEIQLADHIVVADGDYVSMVQSGYRLDEGSYYGQIQAGIGL